MTQFNQESQFDVLMRELPVVRPTAAEIITRSCYQTEYGLYNHERPQQYRPMALVAMHPKEDVLEGGPLFSHIRRFYSHRVFKHFGISLTEFLELPPYIVELLYEIASAEAVQSESMQRTVQRQMEMDLGGELDG